ncbi:MAG: hypothetical protein ACOCYO_00405 [Bacteroidota bacterium]
MLPDGNYYRPAKDWSGVLTIIAANTNAALPLVKNAIAAGVLVVSKCILIVTWLHCSGNVKNKGLRILPEMNEKDMKS